MNVNVPSLYISNLPTETIVVSNIFVSIRRDTFQDNWSAKVIGVRNELSVTPLPFPSGSLSFIKIIPETGTPALVV